MSSMSPRVILLKLKSTGIRVTATTGARPSHSQWARQQAQLNTPVRLGVLARWAEAYDAVAST